MKNKKGEHDSRYAIIFINCIRDCTKYPDNKTRIIEFFTLVVLCMYQMDIRREFKMYEKMICDSQNQIDSGELYKLVSTECSYKIKIDFLILLFLIAPFFIYHYPFVAVTIVAILWIFEAIYYWNKFEDVTL